MKLRLTLMLSFAAALASAQPKIQPKGVVNAASYFAVDGNGSNPIAPGSYFVIFGSGMGPANVTVGSLPFTTQLPDATGTSVKFTGPGGQSFSAFMYYAVSTQVSGIVPSTVPPGQYNVTVTYNGKTSSGEPVFISNANPGLFTRNQAGFGTAKAQAFRSGTDYFETTLSNPAAPGQVIALYGTGLGAAKAADNSAPGAAQVAGPVTVYIDGMAVQPAYAGRSPLYPGLDQINFTLPADVVPNCYTSVIVSVAGSSSNPVSIPTAAPGSTCPHPMGLNAAALAQLDNGGTVNVGLLALLSAVTTGDNSKGDAVLAGVFTMNADNIVRSLTQGGAPNQSPVRVPVGKCAVWDTYGPSPSTNLDVTGWGTDLTAASAVTVTDQSGKTLSLVSGTTLGFGGALIGIAPLGALKPGVYVLRANSATIGTVSASVTVPPAVSWTGAPKDGAPIPRTDLTESWTGGASVVSVAGESSSNASDKTFSCAFNGAAGTGTVPGAVLGQLPVAGPSDNSPQGKLALLTSAYGTFGTPGNLDGGVTIYASGAGASVVWK